ncbi:MAG TPA: ATP-binding cassette domain-containing protein [Candidatus Binatia bacterium]
MSLDARVVVDLGGFRLDVGLEVAPGEVVAVLGPNGAGKTTLLRAIAGLTPLAAGRIVLDGTVLDDPEQGVLVPPEERPLGVVFQDYLLFPHLSALDNVAFGLRCRGWSRRHARREARAWLERVGLAAQASLLPERLSGGQQQRVALVRALAVQPRVLLLDEPLSALDVATRGELRRELRALLGSFAGVKLIVTHDPLEARALADRLVILEEGRIVQQGTPDDVTARPRSAWVSRLAGVNLLRGTAAGDIVRLADGGTLAVPDAGSGEVFVVIQPNAVALHRRRPEGTPRNVWPAQVESIEEHDGRVRVRVGGVRPLVAEVTPQAVAELRLEDRGEVWVSVKATEITAYPV